ncbi:RNA-directed DNA polymerase, eukaryota, nucleotide-binding alpha-beta plait domain protein [Tanacetum coccineum]
MGFRFQNSLQSKIDQTSKISKSVFISNFPDDCSSRDLWKVCNGYGTVVDVFIPNKRSKAGKRFAFVRFINVLNLDRLIENLKTIWIGRFHLSANTARFERPKASTFQKEKPVPSGNVTGFKQPIVQNQGRPKESYSSILKPSLVLDDSCLVNRDLTNCVMGEVLQFSSINNLQVLLSNEGFHNTRVVYLGGLWVMIELKSSKSKSKFMEHVGVASWFRRLCNAQSDFAAKERIVWVDIEGVPLNAWTRSTFQKISSKWGELVELEDGRKDALYNWALPSATEDVLIDLFLMSNASLAFVDLVLNLGILLLLLIPMVGFVKKASNVEQGVFEPGVGFHNGSDVQTALLLIGQILDGPFFTKSNEILAQCNLKATLAMIFIVDFAKILFVRWDYIDDMGLGLKWALVFSSQGCSIYVDEAFLSKMDVPLLDGLKVFRFKECLASVFGLSSCDHVLRIRPHYSSVARCGDDIQKLFCMMVEFGCSSL